MTNKSYDLLMGLTKYVLPAFGTFYLAIAQIWGAPYGEEILGTVVALETLLGIILGVAKRKYVPETDGELVVMTDEDGDKGLSVSLGDPVAVLGKTDIVLKVNNQ